MSAYSPERTPRPATGAPPVGLFELVEHDDFPGTSPPLKTGMSSVLEGVESNGILKRAARFLGRLF